jgi:hypothetical protein
VSETLPPGQVTKPPARPDLSTSRLARFAVATVVFGFFVFIVGVYPGLIRLDLTPGIGLAQIGTFLLGITIMTFGAYLYAYATRHRALPRTLAEDIGVRLMATGLVLCYASGFADVLGIGSHFGSDRPLLGFLQASGVALGVLVIVGGIFLYTRR